MMGSIYIKPSLIYVSIFLNAPEEDDVKNILHRFSLISKPFDGQQITKNIQ